MQKNEIAGEEEKIRVQIKELGSRLRSLREAQGLSIADVSDSTKIQKHYLTAIEEGDLGLLPKGPYVRSFVKQYCEYLSAGDLWKSYDALTAKQKKAGQAIIPKEDKHYSDSRQVFRTKSFIWLYLLIALSLAAAGWITWQYRGEIAGVATSPIDGGTTVSVTEHHPDENADVSSADVAPAPAAAVSGDQEVDLSWMDGKQPQPADGAALKNADQAKKTAEGQPKSVKVAAESAYVWTKVSRGNKVLFEGTMKPGEYREFDVTEDLPLRVRMGKPGNTSIEWEGKKTYPAAPGGKPVNRYFWSDGRSTDK